MTSSGLDNVDGAWLAPESENATGTFGYGFLGPDNKDRSLNPLVTQPPSAVAGDPALLLSFCCEKDAAMPALVVGMLETRENRHMPTTSVGMAPVFFAFRNKHYLWG